MSLLQLLNKNIQCNRFMKFIVFNTPTPASDELMQAYPSIVTIIFQMCSFERIFNLMLGISNCIQGFSAIIGLLCSITSCFGAMTELHE